MFNFLDKAIGVVLGATVDVVGGTLNAAVDVADVLITGSKDVPKNEKCPECKTVTFKCDEHKNPV